MAERRPEAQDRREMRSDEGRSEHGKRERRRARCRHDAGGARTRPGGTGAKDDAADGNRTSEARAIARVARGVR